MQITDIELRNIGPHRHFYRELSQGLVGVVGRNGSGKSHVIDSIYAALTNDWSRLAAKKNMALCDLAGKKDHSFIRLHGEHGGQRFDLCRSIRPSKQWLTVDGEETFTKAPEIAEVLEERFGIERRLLDTYVIVPQWQLFSFLAQTPANRAEAYQNLCGTRQAARIADAIDAHIKELDRDVPPVDEVEGDELRQKLEAAQQEVNDAAARLEQARAGLLGDEAKAHYEEVVRKTERAQQAAQRIEPAQRALESLLEQEQKLQHDANEWRSLAEEIDQAIENTFGPAEARAREALSQLRARSDYLQRRQTLQTRFDQTYAELEAADTPDSKLHSRDSELEEILPHLTELNGRLEQAQSRLEEVQSGFLSVDKDLKLRAEAQSGGGVHLTLSYSQDGLWRSYTGGREEIQTGISGIISEMAKRLADPDLRSQREKEYSDLRVEVQGWRELVNEIRNGRQAYADRQSSREELRQKLEATRQSLRELDDSAPAEPEMSKEEADQALADVQEQRQRRDRAAQKYQGIESERQNVAGQISTRREQIQQAQVEKDQAYSDEEYSRAKEALTGHENARIASARASEAHEAAQRRHGEAQEARDRWLRRRDRSRRAQEYRQRLHQIASVMHRQALPARVAHANLMRMEDQINAVLEHFGSPFWVRPTADLTFEVHFPGAPPRTADQLSGGQKGILAIAFRSVIGSLFAQLDFMALDEPTAGLDEENVDAMREALSAYAADVEGRRQVLMITHADSLRTSFSQVVDLNEESSEIQGD